MHRLEDYRGIVGGAVLDAIRDEAEGLEGMSLAHVNSTYYGGGVAEILTAIVGLFNDVGIDTEWRILKGNGEFFNATKGMHNSLQGKRWAADAASRQVYEEVNEFNARVTRLEGYDCVLIHDPQPLAMIKHYARKQPWVFKSLPLLLGLKLFHKKQPWIWQCHVDLSHPDQRVWDYLKGLVAKYDAAIVSSSKYSLPGAGIPLHVIAPSIDPLSPKNVRMSPGKAEAIIEKAGIPTDKPIVCQVSRFDPWKDPLGVLDAFRKAREKADCRLVLLGNMATDDPEGDEVYKKVLAKAAGMKDVHVHCVEDELLVNALQTHSRVIIQKSLREGFGLTITEALWKGTPVVASNVGGIPLQVKDGVNGYLVASVRECGERVAHLVSNPVKAREMGSAGREHVRNNFLVTRGLLQYLKVIRKTVREGGVYRSMPPLGRERISNEVANTAYRAMQVFSDVAGFPVRHVRRAIRRRRTP